MLKKLVNCLILGSLFTSSAFAGDFLAKVSNGALCKGYFKKNM